MTPSKTYLKFQETRSKEDLDTLNGYLLRLQQISVILNGDTELSNEEENKLYDDDMVNNSSDMLWVYTYADKESLELDLMEILNQMDLLKGCDDQYFDYNVDEVDMVLYGATLIQEQEKYKPLILQKLKDYQNNFDEEEHSEIIDYYINLLEEPETLYEGAEQNINLFKSFIK